MKCTKSLHDGKAIYLYIWTSREYMLQSNNKWHKYLSSDFWLCTPSQLIWNEAFKTRLKFKLLTLIQGFNKIALTV